MERSMTKSIAKNLLILSSKTDDKELETALVDLSRQAEVAFEYARKHREKLQGRLHEAHEKVCRIIGELASTSEEVKELQDEILVLEELLCEQYRLLVYVFSNDGEQSAAAVITDVLDELGNRITNPVPLRFSGFTEGVKQRFGETVLNRVK